MFMFLEFTNSDGKRHEINLDGRSSITFGRTQESDVCIPENRISRIHAEIKLWDSDYVIKDLNSRNGLFVNGIKVLVAVLKAGDVIRIGSHEFTLSKPPHKGTQTIVREVSKEIEEGNKGYRTVLREIVQSTALPRKKV
jgi:pSer/pThr/pTyr-binding forkhead associated (FHA) protein